MTVKSGIAGSLGIGDEATWGLGVAPTVWLPLTSEKLTAEPNYLESDAVRSGRRIRTQNAVSIGSWKVGGDIGVDFTNKSIGLLFKHMFGTVVTTGPASSLYTHTFTPGDLSGLGLTVQVGRPDSATGTIHPYTYTGCKITDWEIACKAGEYATLGATFMGRQEILQWTLADGVTTSGSPTVTSVIGGFSASDIGKPISGGTTAIPALSYIGSVTDANTITLSSSSFTNSPVNATASTTSNVLTMGTALTAVSYASNILPMSFVGASVTVAGTAYKAKEISLKSGNGLADDREFLGQNWLDEALEADLREITGTINSEYFSDVAYHRFLTGTPAATVFSLARGTSTATITMNVQYRGSTANLDGADIVPQELPFTVLGTTTDALGITAVLVDDSAAPAST